MKDFCPLKKTGRIRKTSGILKILFSVFLFYFFFAPQVHAKALCKSCLVGDWACESERQACLAGNSGGGGTTGNILRPFCPANCSICDGSGQCAACREGYIMDSMDNCILPLACPSNCKTCSGGTCTACNPGYALNTEKTACYAWKYTFPDRTTATNTGSDSYCETKGFTWAVKGSGGANPYIACMDKQCDYPSTDANGFATCTRCKSGYRLSNNRCIADPCSQKSCSGATPVCSDQGNGTAQCSCNASSCGAGGRCITHPNYNPATMQNNYSICVCSSGYYLNSSGGCSACPANCSACSNGSSCNECANGYTLSGGKCAKIDTVSSCPAYTTKSSDGCCCIPNG